MKRTLVASILGIAASVVTAVSSYGQGSVWFDNYNNVNVNGPGGYGSPISALGGSINGALIPAGFTVDLYYALGTVSDPNAGTPSGAPIGTLLSSRPVGSPGFVNATIVTAANYVSGPITFELVAHGTAGTTTYIGHSAVLTLPSIATGTSLPGYLDGLQSFSVVPVPEPSMFALAGLGSAALLIFRRRSA
jgi:hypothetical protein